MVDFLNWTQFKSDYLPENQYRIVCWYILRDRLFKQSKHQISSNNVSWKQTSLLSICFFSLFNTQLSFFAVFSFPLLWMVLLLALSLHSVNAGPNIEAVHDCLQRVQVVRYRCTHLHERNLYERTQKLV